MKLLGKGQISRAVARICSFRVAPLDDPAVWAQVEARYPERKITLPTFVPKQSPIDNLGGLKDALLAFKKGVSPGAGGLRPEFLKTLADVLEPGHMTLLQEFGLRHLQGELPAWWYTVWPTVQVVGFYKTEKQDTIRPLGIRNPLLKVLHSQVKVQNLIDLRSFLEPQHIGLSLRGADKLIHLITVLLEEFPNFVFATKDCRNAYNESARASALKAVKEEPSLEHLTWYAATTLTPHGA